MLFYRYSTSYGISSKQSQSPSSCIYLSTYYLQHYYTTSITSACILANTLLTHLTSISSACILINVLASTYAPIGRKPQPGQPHHQLLDQGITPEGWKRGESPDEKVIHADCLCQKCMSRNGNVSLTELAWQAGRHDIICWRTPWPPASPSRSSSLRAKLRLPLTTPNTALGGACGGV